MKYDVIIVGAGPGGIYSAYELTKKCGGKKIAVFDSGYTLRSVTARLTVTRSNPASNVNPALL